MTSLCFTVKKRLSDLPVTRNARRLIRPEVKKISNRKSKNIFWEACKKLFRDFCFGFLILIKAQHHKKRAHFIFFKCLIEFLGPRSCQCIFRSQTRWHKIFSSIRELRETSELILKYLATSRDLLIITIVVIFRTEIFGRKEFN